MITDGLLFRYLAGETRQGENREIRKWLKQDPANVRHLEELDSHYRGGTATDVVPDGENRWAQLEPMLAQSQVGIPVKPAIPLTWIRAAAVVILLAGSYLFWERQAGVQIYRNRDLSAKSISLPDGSRVDLGPKSKLVLERNFDRSTREVKLSGEAFFDVSRNPDKPFTVIAGAARIKVTGTRFTVYSSPASSEVEVSVKSGTVLFYNSETLDKNSFRMGLVAGEKGIFSPALNRMDKTFDPYFRSTP